jgi:predicted nucleotidyltransferase
MMTHMDDEQQLLTQVVSRLRTSSSPARVILFGSVATGTATADSDLDLLVVLDDVADARAESIRLRDALGDLGMPIDVIVMSTERFEETKHVIGGVAYPAHKYGRVIYEAA